MANKFLDSNGVLYLWQKIKAAFASASDMTQAKSDIQALQNVGAQANVIETVKRNGTALTVTNKAVDVIVPTKTSDLTNDSNFAPLASPAFTGTPTAPTPATTDNSTKIATTAFVTSMIAQANTFSVMVVQTLPATGAQNTLYFVPNSGTTGNVYDEYMYIIDGSSGEWELLGTTEVDLSDYMRKTDMVSITNAEIDTILAS